LSARVWDRVIVEKLRAALVAEGIAFEDGGERAGVSYLLDQD
jgi:hypothetical protein